MAAAIVLLATAIIPQGASGQQGALIRGRVVGDPGQGVQNARLVLDGHGTVLSASDGIFAFRNVALGTYRLQVDAFGYQDFETRVTVRGDTIIAVNLEPDPIALDSIRVELETLDFDGRTRDLATDSNLPDAQILTDQGHDETSNVHGRFDLDDVYEGIPLRLGVRAFGYIPLDTTFVPDDEERYPFNLVVDPIMATVVNRKLDELDRRGSEWRYEYQGPLNRENLAQLPSNATLQMTMEARFPLHILRGIGCFFLDEREIRRRGQEEFAHTMQTVLANEIQRIELLEFPGQGRLLMARVYTRKFFQRIMADQRELETPYMNDVGVCR